MNDKGVVRGSVVLGVLFAVFSASPCLGKGKGRANVPPAAARPQESQTSKPPIENLVLRYLAHILKHPNPEAVFLTARLGEQLKKMDPSWKGSPEAQAKAIHNLHSPESIPALSEVINALQRTEYNNAVVLGEGGVGKTHLTDQLTATLAHGLLHDELREAIQLQRGTLSQNSKAKAAIIGSTDVVLLNLSVLSRTAAQGNQPWGDSESRMKNTLNDLFAVAKEEYKRRDGNGKRIGRRTVFLFEELATLPPSVHEALKTLQDETGFHDPERTDLLKEDPGYSVIAFTTPDEYRQMVKGDSAIERRYKKIRIYPPDEQKAFNIVRRKASSEWEDLYGHLIDDKAIEFIIHSRRFLTSPPLAMPASVLAATNDLFLWKAMNPGSDRDIISLQDAQSFLMKRTGVTDVWFEGPNGEPPFHDIAKRLKEHVIDQDAVVDLISQRLSTWGRFQMGSEVPVFFLGGPKGSGKDTIVSALNKVLFGSDGKKLNFSIAGTKGFGIDALIEGPPISNHSDGSIGLLAQALDNHGQGVIALNEGADTPSEEYQKLKVIVEAGEIRPKGRDSRARPLLYPIFILGQWGEELFMNKSEAQGRADYSALTQEQIENYFLTGRASGEYGAVPPALLDRAKKSGGVYILRPVQQAAYPEIVKISVPGMVSGLKKTRNLDVTVQEGIYKFAAAFAPTGIPSTRGLSANAADFTLGALNRALDDGLPGRDLKIKIDHEIIGGVDHIVVERTGAPPGGQAIYSYPALELSRFKAECENVVRAIGQTQPGL